MSWGAHRAELRRPLADELTRGQALRLGALLHDAGKPATRAVNAEGRVLFWGHDGVGAGMAREVVGGCTGAPRWRTTSRRWRSTICASASSCTSARCRAGTCTATCVRASRWSSR